MTIPDYSLPYCTITGTFVAVDADSADPNLNPDVQPLNGTITLTPTTSAGRVDDAFAQIRSVTVRVFGGQIVDDEDIPGVRILATDANIGVADWAWRASFKLEGITLDPLTFKAPRDTTLNLTSGLVPIKSQPYQIIEGASIVDADVDADSGMLRFVLSDGSQTKWIDVPNGARGLPGTPGPPGVDGAAGSPASVGMGTVTAAAAADAWMTGPPQDRQLHLALPRGLKGDSGIQGARGPVGIPATVETTAGVYTVGSEPMNLGVADITGLANRLAVIEQDTGDRDVTSLIAEVSAGHWTVRRVGKWVYMNLYDLTLAPTSGTIWQKSGFLPVGFRPPAASQYVHFPTAQRIAANFTPGPFRVDRYGGVTIYGVTGKQVAVTASWPTGDAFPTAPYGTPA